VARETLAQLRARIDELEERNATLAQENATLAEREAALADRASALADQETALRDRVATQSRLEIAGLDTPADAGTRPAGRGTGPAGPRRAAHVGRSILAGVLVVLGLIVTPVALVVDFAQAQVTDTETFVAAYAPLAESPAVQEAITDAVTTAIDRSVDFEALTGGLVDGLQQLELPRFVSSSLDLLRAPLVEGVNALVRWGVSSIVTSEWFPTVWEQTLRLTHSQLMAVLRGDPNAIAQISGDSVSLQLGPVVAVLRDQLVSSGVTLAQLIPADLDVSIPLADIEGIGNARTFYALAVASGVWLPIIAAALLIGGIAVAPRRRGWVLGTSIALGAIAILFAIALSVGGSAVITLGFLNPDALGFIFGSATGALTTAIAALITVSIVGILAAWFVGPSRLAARARAGAGRFPAIARRRLALTNPVSRGLTRYRSALLWLIGAAAVVTIVFFRPLTVGAVLVTVLIAIVLVLVVEIFRSSAVAAPDASAQEALADPTAQDLAEDVAR